MRTSRRRPVALVATLVVTLAATVLSSCDIAPGTFVFTGGGYGHGVGMSQWGAKGRADAGQSAAEILAAYYPGTTISSPALGGPRIKLGDTPNTQLSQAGSITVAASVGTAATASAAGEPMSIWADGNRVVAQRGGANPGPVTVVAEAGQSATVTFAQGTPMSIAAFGRSYSWGRLVLRAYSAGTLEVVLDNLSMQQYLVGVAEVSSSGPAAALQAQAIASRTFAAYRIAHPQSSRFDLYASTVDQSYVGAAQERAANWFAAVATTDGQIVTWAGQPIQAFYSASNGGWSEASDYVWVGALPYLKAAPDPYDAAVGNPNANWSRTYTSAELQAALVRGGWADPGPVSGVVITGGQGASGRVDRASVVVTGPNGSITLSGNQLRAVINATMPTSRDLLSTKFVVAAGGPAAAAATASSPQNPPRGNLDGSARVSKGLFIGGWAIDGDAPGAPVDVAVYVNDRFATRVRADVDRPEIAPYLPGFGSRHGWGALVAISGRSTVCAYAIDVAPAGSTPAGPNTRIGCVVVAR